MTNPIWTIDFETTGLDTKTCAPVEVAMFNGQEGFDSLIFCSEIPPEVSAVHHIMAEDVALAPSWKVVKESIVSRCNTQPLTVLVAHNAEYDKAVLGDFLPVLWICTYKCALRVWPSAPSHKNEVLRYWLQLGDNRGRNGEQKPHSALHDTKVTWLILQELMKYATIEEMVKWTEEPAKLPKMPMGKHFGQPWNEIPGPYLTWICNQPDMREDVKYCAKQELERRRNPNANDRAH